MRLLPLALALAAPAAAQDYVFELAAGSEADLVSGFAVDLPGSLIGDHDPDTNPDGTRTLPGLFGGSGNQPVDASFGLSGGTTLVGGPTGGFVLGLDLDGGAVEVEGLDVDLLGGAAGSTDLFLHLEFGTFRTFDPDSVYFGDFPIDLPLGSQEVRDVRLTQVGPSLAGTVAGDAGSYTFGALVPATLSFVVVVGETETPVGPLPLLLPLAGGLTLAGDAASATFGFELSEAQVIEDPLPGFELTDVPFDLPTILPPGDVAHLLLNAVVEALTLEVDLGLEVVAEGQAACGFESYCVGNVNSTGFGAVLRAVGSASLSDADLVFTGAGLPTEQFAYLMIGPGRDELPFFRGSQGTLCLAMPVLKFTPHVMPTGHDGLVEVPVDLQDLPPGVEFVAGDAWSFQLWYRDLNPGITTNTSNAVEVLFCR